jgi:hypothetical protein
MRTERDENKNGKTKTAESVELSRETKEGRGEGI